MNSIKSTEIFSNGKISQIITGDKISNLSRYLPPETVVITDVNVNHLYGGYWSNWPNIAIGVGEKTKTLDTVNEIYRRLLEYEVDRSGFIVGVGGGIVCDIAGFVASTYLRGIRFGFVPTTLLAQVDAAIGGKNGINYNGFKNQIGTINQPDFVLCDPVVLQTLPKELLADGISEVIKHALIAEEKLLDFIENNYNAILSLDLQTIGELIHHSVKIKTEIVNQDEKENGERRKLNFGHTLGHAIEKVTGINHGKAVSIGMLIAAEISTKKGLICSDDLARIQSLLKLMNLPVNCPSNRLEIIDAVAKDKKRQAGQIYFILLAKLGKAIIQEIGFADLAEYIKESKFLGS